MTLELKKKKFRKLIKKCISEKTLNNNLELFANKTKI